MPKLMWVYIMASRSGCLYIGVTNNIYRRVAEHRTRTMGAFSTRYQTHRLIYMETMFGPVRAIAREKQLKRWSRVKKVRLIEQHNPNWRDLAEGWA